MASSWDSQIRSQSCDTSGWGGSQALKLIGIPGLVTASWGAVPHLEVENRKVPAVSRMHQGTADCSLARSLLSTVGWGHLSCRGPGQAGQDLRRRGENRCWSILPGCAHLHIPLLSCVSTPQRVLLLLWCRDSGKKAGFRKCH